MEGATEVVVKRAQQFFSGDARLFVTAPLDTELRNGLASSSPYTVLTAMKRVIAQMCKGVDMHQLFPDVVKVIHSPVHELRALVYCYVVQYAAACPSEALLTISAFQKDLTDESEMIRATAMRMLGSIPIPAIQGVVMVALVKCSTDISPVVRKAAAIAVHQVISIGGNEGNSKLCDREALSDVLKKLLLDPQPDVVGSAAMAWVQCFPTDVSIIHAAYRNLCLRLIEADEFSQVSLLRALTRYARLQFLQPSDSSPPLPGNSKGHQRKGYKSPSDSSSSEKEDETSSNRSTSSQQAARPLDPDHALFINCTLPLLRCLAPATVLAATTALYHCAPRSSLTVCLGPLIRVMGFYPALQQVVLVYLQHLLPHTSPEPLAPYYSHFLPVPEEAQSVRALKLQLLAAILPSLSPQVSHNVLRELQRNAMAPWAASQTMLALGRVLIHSTNSSRDGTSPQQPFLLPIARLLKTIFRHPNACVGPGSTERAWLLRVAVQCSQSMSQTSVGAEDSEMDDDNQEEDTTSSTMLVGIIHRLVRSVLTAAASSLEELLKQFSVETLAEVVNAVSLLLYTDTLAAAAAPDFFRVLLQSFSSYRSSAIKVAVLHLGLRVWLQMTKANADGVVPSNSRITAVEGLLHHGLRLASSDSELSLRDEARRLNAVVSQDEGGEAWKASWRAVCVMRLPPPSGSADDPCSWTEGGDGGEVELGCFSSALHLQGYDGVPRLPAWRLTEEDCEEGRKARFTSLSLCLPRRCGSDDSDSSDGGLQRREARHSGWSSSSSSASGSDDGSSDDGGHAKQRSQKRLASSTTSSAAASSSRSSSSQSSSSGSSSSSSVEATAAPPTRLAHVEIRRPQRR